MDWTAQTTDPTNDEMLDRMLAYLQSIRRTAGTDYVDWLLQQVRNKSCLDIGAIEHDLSFTERPTWKHKLVSEASSRTVGIDILEDYVETLKQRGYDIRSCDATSDEFIGETFDVVIIGDVIEHVDNPVKLVRFALRHLNQDGIAVAKTPNPFFYDHIKKYTKNKAFINADHMAWFSPSMALEIARRAECSLDSYLIFPESGKPILKRLLKNPDLFSRDFVYVFKHKGV
jgi:2-polyprenyl-3-methyl-5-hydroxy-6-metoxy-1,4-benzoquinol methylase